MTVPWAMRDSMRRRRIMASATSVHWNSSKQRTEERSAMPAATKGIASMSLPCCIFILWRSLCTLCIKAWKCILVLCVMFGGRVSKKRSIIIVLPEPTSPYMYMPFGRFESIGGSAATAGCEDDIKEKKDFLGGCKDSIVG